MKIVVLAGGLSTERAVSLVTGTSVCRALREDGHRAILVDVFLGVETLPEDPETLFDAPDGLCPHASIETAAPDLDAVRKSRLDGETRLLGPNVLELCALADIVFLGLHGQDGEDGRIQAALDILGVPYTGSGYLGSGMAMDKSLTKYMMEKAGIPTAPWRDIPSYTEADIPALAAELEVPCAVKIVNGGSSIGVALPDTREELETALQPRHRGKEDPGPGADGGRSGRGLSPGGGDRGQVRQLRLRGQVPDRGLGGDLPGPHHGGTAAPNGRVCPAAPPGSGIAGLLPDGLFAGREGAALVLGGQLPAGIDSRQPGAQGGRRRRSELQPAL